MLRRPVRLVLAPDGNGGSTYEWREDYFPGTRRGRGDGGHALGITDPLQAPSYRDARSLYEDNEWFVDST